MWGTLVLIGLQIGLYAYVYFTRDEEEIEADSEKRLRRGSTTVAEEGSSVGMVFGTCRVHKTNILMYPYRGAFRDYLLEAKEESQYFSGDNENQLHLSAMLGVCARSLNTAHKNEFRRLWIGESLVADLPFEQNTQNPGGYGVGRLPRVTFGYDVDDTPLWGGPGKGGGVGGIIYTMKGDGEQQESWQGTQMMYKARTGSAFGTGDAFDLSLGGAYGASPGVMTMLLWGFKIGEGTSMPGFSVEVRCKPQYNAGLPISIESSVSSPAGDATVNVLESNPAACLYLLLTDEWVGLGLPQSKIDLQSFSDAADTLYTEGNGFSMYVEKATKAKKIIKEIIKQIDGTLYLDPTDQKLYLGLVREDYNLPSLPIFDDSNVVKIASYKETAWADTYNEVRLTYEDRRAEYVDKFAVAQDSSNASASGRIKSININFPGVKVASTANKLAARELKFYATPQTHVSLHINRQGSSLRPGSVLKWTSDAYQITEMVLRVHRIALSETDDGIIVVDCTRDKYSDVASIFNDPDTHWLDDFGIKPTAPGCLVVQEVPPAPPFNGGSNWQQPMHGGVMVNASPLPTSGGGTSGPGGFLNPNTSVINVSDGDVLASTGDDRNSTPCGIVGVAYSTSPGAQWYYDTSTGVEVSFTEPVDFIKNWTEEEVREGRAIISIGDEFLSYESYTDTDAPTYRSSAQTETADNQSSISIALPAGVVDGDLLIAMINLGPEGLDSAPADWTHVDGSPYRNTGGGRDNNFVVMTKVASSETGPYVWTRTTSDPMEIQGSLHAFYNATLEFARISAQYDTVAAGVNENFYSSGNISSELVVTGISISDSWWSGTSLISPTKGFTEIDDSSSAIDGHLQVQYGPVTITDEIDRLGVVGVDLNLSGVTPTSAFTTVILGIKGPATRSYKLNNVWRGLFDTVPVSHTQGDPVFFVSEVDPGEVITQKGFSCDDGVVLSQQTLIGNRTQSIVPTLTAGIVLTRRSERPARPTSFVLRDDGADAAASGPEFDYAYDVDDSKAIVNASVSGADTKVSYAGVYGDVWSNDLRATWSRRPKLASCEGSVVRGDDPDEPYGTDENTSLRVDAKGDQEADWSTITQDDVKGDAIRSNTEFVDMSQAKSGAGTLRLCTLGESPLTGEVLASREAESVTVDVHTSRQLLRNPNFRPYWDVDSDSSIASGKGEVLPGNPVYSARGWRNVTPGAGRPRYLVMPSILQGDNTEGFAFFGEFIPGEFIYIEQVVSVPYLDTEGSEIYLSFWFQGSDDFEPGDFGWYDVTIDTLDVNGVVLDTTNLTNELDAASAFTWTKFDLTLTAMSAAARSIRVTVGIRNVLIAVPAICKMSMVMGRDTASDQLINSNFDNPLTNWTSVGSAFTSELAPTYGGGINTVDNLFDRFAQSGTTDGEIYQDVAIPAAYGTGDYVRLQWWTATTGASGYGYIVLSTRDDVSVQVESITVGGDPHPIFDQWYYHEAYLKITGECADVRASINYKAGGGAGEDFLCDAMDMTFIKGGHS